MCCRKNASIPSGQRSASALVNVFSCLVVDGVIIAEILDTLTNLVGTAGKADSCGIP